jgi:hypothetical protein
MDGSTSLIWAFGITKEFHAGCSKSPISKAVASEEARRYQPHFVWLFARKMDLGERNISSSTSEPLSDARTPLAGFFSILLEFDLRFGEVAYHH